jgi:hypothetical protein
LLKANVTKTDQRQVYWEFIDYLAEHVLAYKISEPLQERIEDLLDRNNEGDITAEERQELDQFVEFDQHVVVLKAKAAARLQATR